MIYTKPMTMNSIPNLELRVLRLLEDSGLLDRAREEDAAFHIVWDLLDHIPELRTAFLGHTVLGGAAYIMYTDTPGHPHKDDSTSLARVNIPILNTEHTVTEFWQLRTGEPERIPQPNGLIYECYDHCELECVHSVCIDQPTIIRVREIHSVRMHKDHVPRITLTLKLDPDPVVHLEKEHVGLAD